MRYILFNWCWWIIHDNSECNECNETEGILESNVVDINKKIQQNIYLMLK